jgi:hypothetical protein
MSLHHPHHCHTTKSSAYLHHPLAIVASNHRATILFCRDEALSMPPHDRLRIRIGLHSPFRLLHRMRPNRTSTRAQLLTAVTREDQLVVDLAHWKIITWGRGKSTQQERQKVRYTFRCRVIWSCIGPVSTLGHREPSSALQRFRRYGLLKYRTARARFGTLVARCPCSETPSPWGHARTQVTRHSGHCFATDYAGALENQDRFPRTRDRQGKLRGVCCQSTPVARP